MLRPRARAVLSFGAGVMLECHDGRTRKVFVRVLGFSGDAPELNEIAARAGSCDPALDADVGSDDHLIHFSGGTPRWVAQAQAQAQAPC